MAVPAMRLNLAARAGPAAALAAGEAGGALLGRLVRLEARSGLVGEALVQGHAEALDRRAPVGQHRHLWEGGERLRVLEGAVEVSAGGHDLGDEPDLERLLRGHHAAGEDDVQSAAQADDARQPLRAAI